METIQVIALAGTSCPKEGRPRDLITDSIPVQVPATPYYLRLINDGSLFIAQVGADRDPPRSNKE